LRPINIKLEGTDFRGKNGNNIVPKQNFNVGENNIGLELQNMNLNNFSSIINNEVL